MKANLLKYIALSLLIASISSCSSYNKYIRVENVKEVNTLKHNPLIYSLPKTSIIVKVTASNEISVRGPYYQYAQKYIGTDDVITNNTSKWTLSNVEISSYPIKDTSRTFVVETNYLCAMNFSPEGFLESINTKPDFQEQSYRQNNFQSSNNSNEDIISRRQFQELNVNRYETVFDTLLHVVDADSIFTAVPTGKRNLVRKSLDEQAQELANQIFTLRDDKNALLVGESDGKSLPTGDGLKFMVEQLNKLEEAYLSMFVGKKLRTEKTYIFEYVPSQDFHSNDILYKFSPEYGVLPKTSNKGNPVQIDILNMGETTSELLYDQKQERIRQQSKTSKEINGIAYLSNVNALVKILQGNNSIAEKVININQMSPVRYLNEKMMQNPDFKLILYPTTGTIKSLN